VVREVAGELGATPAQVALRWVTDRPAVVAPIVGARTVRQLDDSIGAASLRLDEAQRARLDEVSSPPTPDYPYRVIDEQCSDRVGVGQA